MAFGQSLRLRSLPCSRRSEQYQSHCLVFTPRIFDFLNKQPFVLRMVTLFARKCRTGTPFKNGKRVFKFANTGKPPGN